MVKRCAHGLCKTDSRYPQTLAGGVMFYPFPKPKTQLQKCLEWIKQCGRPHSQLNVSKINKHTYVCSKHFVNGYPSADYPNPIHAAVQVSHQRKEQLGGCRNPRKRLELDSSTFSTDDADKTQQHDVDKESPEHPPLPGCQLERKPVEGKSNKKKRTLTEENEILYWKLKLSSKETEIQSLKAQISTLKKKTLTPELLESSEIPKMLEYSTGFTYKRFNQLCTIFGIPNNPHTTQLNVPLNYKRCYWQVADVPLRCQLLLVLMKLRTNENLKNLAFRFNINMKTASNILNSWIHYMYYVFGELPIWPHRDVIIQNMPETCKADYPSTFAILHCTELKIKRPTSLVLQHRSFSNNKSPNTLKSLIACDPHGALIFSSSLFTGSMSNKEIVRQCGIIPLLKKLLDSGHLQRGDGIMADEGFLIEDEMRAVGLQLNLPPFLSAEMQISAGDVVETNHVEKHMMHVERAIAKIKKFKIVSDKIPHTRLGIINQIWYVVSMLSNFQPLEQ